MIEKRFTYVIDNGENTIYDLSKKGIILENFIEIEEMLNNLNNENKQLKQTIDKLTLDNTKQKKLLNTTKKENEQLKQELAKKKRAKDIWDVEPVTQQHW